MARSCNFDREDKLKLAMELFWQKGYAATSVADLVEHLGINRFSLYNTYGDKLNLYREALRLYLQQNSLPALDSLRAEGAGLQQVIDYLEQFVALQREQKYGCFLQNALLEMSLEDAVVQQESRHLFDSIKEAFAKALTHARECGELNSDNPEALAAWLLLQLQGIRVLGKAGLHQELQQALSVMRAQLGS
ncbi:TetR/AcrR family transcriptional regulator [Shewanella algae]|uniref:TetR/AcrR family transcriptional regulator n=1 Tax=Shewanella algae TaxID=38313 RepID=UPI0031F531FB